MSNQSFSKKVLFIFVLLLFLTSTLSAGILDQMGKEAPDFKLPKLNSSDTVSLSELRGKVVLVDFWATWCPPCKKSLPFFEKLDNKYKNLQVIAINIDDDKKNASQFLEQNNLKLTAVYDADKSVVGAFDVPVMPTAYLIDQYGKIQYIHSGYSEENMKKLEFAIRGLVDRP